LIRRIDLRFQRIETIPAKLRAKGTAPSSRWWMPPSWPPFDESSWKEFPALRPTRPALLDLSPSRTTATKAAMDIPPAALPGDSLVPQVDVAHGADGYPGFPGMLTVRYPPVGQEEHPAFSGRLRTRIHFPDHFTAPRGQVSRCPAFLSTTPSRPAPAINRSDNHLTGPGFRPPPQLPDALHCNPCHFFLPDSAQ
jgi:hypothetical protein